MADDRSATAPFRDAAHGEGVALLIIDMIVAPESAGDAAMLDRAGQACDAILALREQADAAGAPVVYINDNFGEWHSERSRLIDRARQEGPARSLIERLLPRDDDYFVIKPQFSAFYATNLPVLLPKLGVGSLVITGLAADICVLFTAGDAHMRDYRLWVPADGVAAASDERWRGALDIMKSGLRAEVRPTGALTLDTWMAAGGSRSV